MPILVWFISKKSDKNALTMDNQIIIALTSGFIGGAAAIIGVYFTNRSNEARLKKQLEYEEHRRKADLLRERGEELYLLTDKWMHAMAGYQLRRYSVILGKLTYNQCNDLEIKAGQDKSYNFGRIEMLIDVYFPLARKEYDEVISSRNALNEVLAEHRGAYTQGDIDGRRFINPFLKCQQNIDATGERLKVKIIEYILAI